MLMYMHVKRSILGRADLKAASMPKGAFTDKRGRGFALLVAGSYRYHGAPVLASMAAYSTISALRVGAGYAKLYVPKSVVATVRSLSPNIIVCGLGYRSITCNSEILGEVAKADAVAIGMGIGRSASATRSAGRIIGRAAGLGKATVVDADAIRALNSPSLRKRLCRSVIATPHDGEFAAMTGIRLPREDTGARIERAVECARRMNITLVLKGHETIVTDGYEVRVNRAKTAALATMGTGDVLSGIICGYASTGAQPMAAACAGVYLHSAIGDALARAKGSHVIAQDVADAIPSIIKEFDKSI